MFLCHDAQHLLKLRDDPPLLAFTDVPKQVLKLALRRYRDFGHVL